FTTAGSCRASGGKLHSCETPTSASCSPSAKLISVAAGNSETIRTLLDVFLCGRLRWQLASRRQLSGRCGAACPQRRHDALPLRVVQFRPGCNLLERAPAADANSARIQAT